MRHLVNRTRASAALAALALASSILAGCDRLKPQGEGDTMSQLKAGSEKVCVAPDVQAMVRKLVVPDVSRSTDMTSLDQRQKALGTISLSYDLTTLQSFDKGVLKATCNTTVQISGLDGKSSKFKLTYDVTPSADRPGPS